jgi:[ribosomal protein S5]-alanine N-acetyltransferase
MMSDADEVYKWEENGPFETARLVLTRLQTDHAPALFPLLNDWDVVRMLAEPSWPLALADVEAYSRRSAPTTGIDDFAVLLSGMPIGVVSLKRPGSGNPPRTMPRIGFWLGRAYWNQGFGREAVGRLLGFSFFHFLGETLGAGVFADNSASHRVLETLGFEPVGSYETYCRSRGTTVATIDMHLPWLVFEGLYW